jgi:hypothetical protein
LDLARSALAMAPGADWAPAARELVHDLEKATDNGRAPES